MVGCLTGDALVVACLTGEVLTGDLCLRGDGLMVVIDFLGDSLMLACFLGDLLFGVAGVQDCGVGRFTTEAVVICILTGLLAGVESVLAARGAGTGCSVVDASESLEDVCCLLVPTLPLGSLCNKVSLSSYLVRFGGEGCVEEGAVVVVVGAERLAGTGADSSSGSCLLGGCHFLVVGCSFLWKSCRG